MYIPTFANVLYVDRTGYLTNQMQIYHDQLSQALQNGLSDNGWTFPPITAANLAIVSPLMPDGTMWIVADVSPQQLVVKLDGSLRKITTTAYP